MVKLQDNVLDWFAGYLPFLASSAVPSYFMTFS